MAFSPAEQAEILQLFETRIQSLFPKVRIPELPPFTQFRDLDLGDRIPIFLMGQNKTVWCDLQSLKYYIETGGDVAIEPVLVGSSMIHDITASEAGGDTVYLPTLAGKSFMLRLEGRPLTPDEFEILNSGGFVITIPGYELSEGQRFDIEVYELQVTDGGSNGGSGGFITGAVTVNGNLPMTAEEHAGKLMQIRAGTSNIEITLPQVQALPLHSLIPFEASVNNSFQAAIKTLADQKIYINGQAKTIVHISPGETAWLYVGEDGFYVIAGDLPLAYRMLLKPLPALKKGADELPMSGIILQRSQFPRVWEELQATPGVLVDENVWQTNRTRFSRGDGISTFRMADWTGLFLRGVTADMGRYQAQELKSHTHLMQSPNGESDESESGTTGGYMKRPGAPGDAFPVTIGFAGGDETRPENVGVLWVIKY